MRFFVSIRRASARNVEQSWRECNRGRRLSLETIFSRRGASCSGPIGFVESVQSVCAARDARCPQHQIEPSANYRIEVNVLDRPLGARRANVLPRNLHLFSETILENLVAMSCEETIWATIGDPRFSRSSSSPCYHNRLSARIVEGDYRMCIRLHVNTDDDDNDSGIGRPLHIHLRDLSALSHLYEVLEQVYVEALDFGIVKGVYLESLLSSIRADNICAFSDIGRLVRRCVRHKEHHSKHDTKLIRDRKDTFARRYAGVTRDILEIRFIADILQDVSTAQVLCTLR